MTIDSIAALMMSAALLVLVSAGFAVMLGAKSVATKLGGASASLLLVSLSLHLLAGWISRLAAHGSSLGSGVAGGEGPGGSALAIFILLFVLGHLVLASVLVARRLRPDAAADEVQERERDRLRERRHAPLRHEEVER